MATDKKKGRRNQISKGFRKFSNQIKGSDKRKPVFIKRNIYQKKKLKKRVKDHGIFCSCS